MTYKDPNGQEYYTGSVVRSPIFRFVRRTLSKKLAMAGIPFDWINGIFSKVPKIKNQQTSYSCGGQAGSYLLSILKPPYIETSAKTIYSPKAYPQGGMTVPDLISQMCNQGATFETTVPSYYINGACDERLMIDKSWINPKTLKEALKTAGYTAKHVNIDIESIAEAIRDWGGAIMEIRGQNNGTWLTSYPKPPMKGWGDMWQHFMCLNGALLKNGQKTISAIQSWGPFVGDSGYQYFTDEYIKSGHILDVFVLIPKQSPNIQPIVDKQTNDAGWLAIFFKFLKKAGLIN